MQRVKGVQGMAQLLLVCTWNAAQGVVLWYGLSGSNSTPLSKQGRLWAPAAPLPLGGGMGWEGTWCCAARLPRALLAEAPWHLYGFITAYARSSQLTDQAVPTVEGVKVFKKKHTTTKKHCNSVVGCFSLEGLLCEQQKEGERHKLFTLILFSHLGVRRQ